MGLVEKSEDIWWTGGEWQLRSCGEWQCIVGNPYRVCLQYLNLDLSNCSETLDEELLELVKVCECLEQLRVWAFLEVSTVQRLLHIRLTQRSLLNKIRVRKKIDTIQIRTYSEVYCHTKALVDHYVFQVRIYSANEDLGEEEDQLEEVLSSYLNLPPELDLFAKVYPYV